MNLDTILRDAFRGEQTQKLAKATKSDSISLSEGSAGAELQRYREMQTLIRPYFGKLGTRAPKIGDHPDYMHLKKNRGTEFGPVTTLFMDIAGSTKLGLVYSPEQVYEIKNRFITTAIDLVSAFDGHVHRIMGDAVMAYFGGTSVSVEQGAIDALNCASVLRYFAVWMELRESKRNCVWSA